MRSTRKPAVSKSKATVIQIEFTSESRELLVKLTEVATVLSKQLWCQRVHTCKLQPKR